MSIDIGALKPWIGKEHVDEGLAKWGPTNMLMTTISLHYLFRMSSGIHQSFVEL